MDYKVYESHITDLCAHIGMPEDKLPEILKICREICESEEMAREFLDIQKAFFGYEETREACFEAGKKHGYEPFFFALVYMLMYSLHTKEIYEWRRYPTEVYYDSFIDLVIWSNVSEAQNGFFGIANYGWVSEQVRADMYRIGRLQFHYVTYGEGEYSHAGVTVRGGDKVINIHIPEGEPFTREKRLDSYRKAYKFFGQTGNAVFVCESWLLHSFHREYLGEKSNIVDFMDDFTITSQVDHPAPFGDAWRVFGFRDSYDPDTLPTDTSLQRAYVRRLKEGGTVGYAHGIFVFDGENILK